jgi:hypothetical protein
MADIDDFRELKGKIEDGTITSDSKEQLEKYVVLLSKHNAFDKFTDRNQFLQSCETIRLLLIKKYTEEVDKQNAITQASNLTLQEQNVDLQRRNVRLQRVVVVLMLVTILTSAIQIYVTLRPNSQLQQQIELLQSIRSDSSEIQKSCHNLQDNEKNEIKKTY